MQQHISRRLVVIILLGLLLGGFLPRVGAVTAVSAADPSPAQTLEEVWQKLQGLGSRPAASYSFSSDVHQIRAPSPSPANAGLTARQTEFHAKGDVHPPQEQMTMTLWLQGGRVNDPNSGATIKVEDGRTYVRQQNGTWEQINDITQSFAPDNNFAAYLVAAENVALGEPVDENGQSLTRYTFSLNGPRFARYMQRQMERQERERGKPAFLEISLSQTYRDMEGTGEIWVDEAGWPVYQHLEITLPQEEGAETELTIKTTFSDFVTETAVAPAGPTAASGGIGFSLAAVADAARSTAPLSLGLLGLGLFLAVLGRAVRSRRVYGGVIAAVIALLLITPHLKSVAAAIYQDDVAARRAAQAEKQEEQQQVNALTETIKEDRNYYGGQLLAMIRADNGADSDRDGLSDVQEYFLDSDPLLANRDRAEIGLQTGNLDPTDPTDSDGDGLTDYEETLLGTSSSTADIDGDGVFDGVDTDGDGVSDFDEVTTAYTVNGRTRYADPLEIDSNSDGRPDGLEWNTDSDGDGVVDLFDDDDDGDGVPDKRDLSPTAAPNTAFSEDNPFAYKVDGLDGGQYTYTEFQLRPTNPDQLWYAFSVFDWPYDDKGNIQDVTEKTFADLPQFNNEAPYNYGDMQVIPMLEIKMGAGDAALLPEESVLEDYGISVSAGDNATYAYVPLQLVNDQRSGEKFAFYGKLLYDTPALSDWTADHQARLAWVVQGLLDRTERVCDQYNPDICWQETVEADKLSLLHVYYSDWELTGLNVRQDLGTEVAFAYEDPAVDPDYYDDAPLLKLASGLDESFMAGRDCDVYENDTCTGDGRRDITLTTIAERFDHPNNDGVSATEQWNLPDIFRVKRQAYSHIDEALVKTATEDTQALVFDDLEANGPSYDFLDISPLVLFAMEERYRAANLEQSAQNGDYFQWDNGRLTLDFNAGDGVPELLSVGLNVTPYQYDNNSDTWTRHDLIDYLDAIESRWEQELSGDNLTEEELAGHILLARLYMTSLYSGASAVIQHDGVNIGSDLYARPDTKIARTIGSLAVGGAKWAVNKMYMNIPGQKVIDLTLKGFTKAVNTIKNLKNVNIGGGGGGSSTLSKIKNLGVIKKVKDYFGKGNSSWARLSKVGSIAGKGVLAIGMLAGVALVAASYFFADELGEGLSAILNVYGATIIAAIYFIFTVVMPVITVINTINKLVNAGMSTARAVGKVLFSSSSLIGTSAYVSAIALVVQLGVLWNIFIFTVMNNNLAPGSIEFNLLLAQTLAAAIVAIVVFLISLTVIGTLIISVLTALDIFLGLVFNVTITGYLTNLLADAIYAYEAMIDADADDLVQSGSLQTHLSDPEAGLVDGNTIYFSMPLTTTIRHNKDEVDVRTAPYYTADTIRDHTFRHFIETTTAAVPRTSQPSSSWQVSQHDSWGPFPLYEGKREDTVVSPPQTLVAGLNNRVTLRIGTYYEVPLLTCWTLYCDTDEEQPGLTERFTTFYYDVLPATLDDFFTFAAKDDGGYGLAWDDAFGSAVDPDNDGYGVYDGDHLDPDRDGDGLADGAEQRIRQNGLFLSDATYDTDNDGLSDGEEIFYGTYPLLADTDGDGVSDYDEIHGRPYTYNTGKTTLITTDPLLPDSDGDGMSDGREWELHQSTPELSIFNPRVFDSPAGVNMTPYTAVSPQVVAPGDTITFTANIINNSSSGNRDLSGSLNVAFAPALGGATTAFTQSLTTAGALSTTFASTVPAASATQTATISMDASARLESDDIIGLGDMNQSSAAYRANSADGRALTGVDITPISGAGAPYAMLTRERDGDTGDIRFSLTDGDAIVASLPVTEDVFLGLGSRSAADVEEISLACNDNALCLATWVEGDATQSLQAALIDAAAPAINATLTITQNNETDPLTAPAVASDGADFLLGWTAPSDAFRRNAWAQLIRADGATGPVVRLDDMIPPEFQHERFWDDQDADIVWDGGRYRYVWSHGYSDAFAHIWSIQFDSSGQRLDDTLSRLVTAPDYSTTADAAELVYISSTGETALFYRQNDGTGGQIKGLFIDSGAPPFTVANADAAPRAAYDAFNQALIIAWTEVGPLRNRAMAYTVNGEPLAPAAELPVPAEPHPDYDFAFNTYDLVHEALGLACGDNGRCVNGVGAVTGTNFTGDLHHTLMRTLQVELPGVTGAQFWGYEETFTVQIDNDTPTATLDALPAYLAPGDAIVISGAAADPTSSVEAVEIRIDGGPWQEAQGTNTWTYLLNAPTVGGDYTIDVRAIDELGHVQATPASAAFTVDATPPTLTSNIAAGALFTQTQNNGVYYTIPLSGTVSDSQSGVAYVETQVQPLGQGWQRAAITGTNWAAPYQLALTNGAGDPVRDYSGVYTVSLRAADRIGHPAAPITFTINVDERPPTVTLASLTDATIVLTDTQPLTGTITESGAYTTGIAAAETAVFPADAPLAPGLWRGSYYAGWQPAGAPDAVQFDPALDFDWGAGAPVAGMPTDYWSARWDREAIFQASGVYTFTINQESGHDVRVYLDGQTITPPLTDGTTVFTHTIAAGVHDLAVTYKDGSYGAYGAQLSLDVALAAAAWQPLDLAASGGGVASTTWSGASTPDNIEGFFEVAVRGYDGAGNTEPADAAVSRLWRGLIDTQAPRVDVDASFIGVGAAAQTVYTLHITDFALDETSIEAPCELAPGDRYYYDSPWWSEIFPDVDQLYEVVAECRVSGHVETLPQVTACDLYGHCTTANDPLPEPPQGNVAYFPGINNSAEQLFAADLESGAVTQLTDNTLGGGEYHLRTRTLTVDPTTGDIIFANDLAGSGDDALIRFNPATQTYETVLVQDYLPGDGSLNPWDHTLYHDGRVHLLGPVYAGFNVADGSDVLKVDDFWGLDAALNTESDRFYIPGGDTNQVSEDNIIFELDTATGVTYTHRYTHTNDIIWETPWFAQLVYNPANDTLLIGGHCDGFDGLFRIPAPPAGQNTIGEIDCTPIDPGIGWDDVNGDAKTHPWLDVAGQKLYYIENPDNTTTYNLRRMDVDGSNDELVIPSLPTRPYDLAIDINHAPVAGNQFLTTTHDTPITFTLDAGDVNLGTTLNFTYTAVPTGAVNLPDATATQPITVTYIPPAGFSGMDQFSYRVSDGRLADEATVAIQVLPENTLSTAVLTPTAGALLTGTTPVAVTIAGHADTPGQVPVQRGVKEMTFSVNGAQVDSHTPPADTHDVLWTPTWTPAAAGTYTLTATTTNWNNDTTSYDAVVTVDTDTPSVTLDTAVLTTTHLLQGSIDRVQLAGTASDSAGVARVQVALDGQIHTAALDPASGRWTLPWTVPNPETTLPAVITVTDRVGRIDTLNTNLTIDLTPPTPADVTLSADGVPLAATFPQVVTAAAPSLAIDWTASSDGSGVGGYHVGWTGSPTPTVSALTDYAAASTHSETAGEAQTLYAHVGAYDIYGNIRWQTLGPVYADSPVTPDLIALDQTAWRDSGASQLVEHRQRSAANPQRFYASWDDSALRLTWRGANWDGGGDLFIYLDTAAGGAASAYNPYGDGVTVNLPAENGDQMAADSLIWVSDAMTATLLTWDGAAWQTAQPLTTTNFLVDGENTDLYLPFSLLGVADPANTPAKLLAFATEENALRLWAAAPDKNPLNSAAVVGAPADPAALTTIDLTQYVDWAGFAAGVRPNQGHFTGADLQLSIRSSAPAAALGYLGSDLYNLLTPGAPIDADLDGSPDRPLPVANPTPLSLGETVVYTVTYENTGSGPATGVTLDLSTFGGLTVTGGPQTVTIGDVPAGVTGTVTINAAVNAPANGRSVELNAVLRDDSHAPYDWFWFQHDVDSVAPADVVIDAPTGYARAVTQTVSGAAVDRSDLSAVTVEITDPDSNVTTLTACDISGNAWSCPWDPGVVTGAHSLRAQVTDVAGNSSGWSAPVTVTIDSEAPVLTLGTLGQSLLAGGVVNDDFTLSGVMADDFAGRRVHICGEAVVTDTQCAQQVVAPMGEANAVWSTPVGIGDGEGVTETLRLIGEDMAGNQRPFTLTYRIDTVPPAITVTDVVTEVLLSDYLYGGVPGVGSSTPVISGTLRDGYAPGETFVRVTGPSGAAVTSAADRTLSDANTAAWQFVPAFTETGVYTLTVEGVDEAGNVASLGETFTVTVRAADLAITKTGPAVGYTGWPLTYTLSVANNGALPVSSLIISDTLPAPLRTAGGNGWSCGETAGVLTCTLPSLAAGQSVTTTVALTAPLTAGPITNTAAIGYQISDDTALLDATPADNRSAVITTIGERFDLHISKAADRAAAVPGTPLTYTIVAGNAGPDPISGALVSDAFPAALNGVSWTCTAGAGATCTAAGSGDINDAVDLAVGSVITYTASGVVDPAATGQLANTAAITETVSAAAGIDHKPGNNQDGAAVTLTPQADLTLTIDESADPVPAGSGAGNLTYVLTVTNRGPSAAGNVLVGDTITVPAGVTIDAFTPGVGTFANDTWTIPALPPSASGLLTATLTVDDTAAAGSDVITNTAVIQSVDQARINPGDDAVTETTSIATDTEIVVTMAESADPVVAGSGAGNLVYTTTVENLGPSPAGGVVVSQTLAFPAGVTLDAVTAPAGTTWDGAAWTVGDLAIGETTVLTSVFTVGQATISGTNVISGAAQLAAVDTTDVNPGNNQAAVATSVTNVADLEVGMTAAPDPVVAGTSITYTVVVTNDGPSIAPNVVVTAADRFDAITYRHTDGCPQDPNGFPVCELGALAAGETVSYTLVADVNPDQNSNQLSHTATVASDADDPTSFDAETTVITTVELRADVTFTISDAPDPVTPGNPVTYTVALINHGPSDAGVDADFGVNLSTNSSGDCDWTWRYGQSIAAGETQVCTIVAYPRDPLPADTVITATADVALTGFTVDPIPDNNTITETTTLRGLEFTVGDATVTEGDSGAVEVTLVLTRSYNAGYAAVDVATVDGTATAGADYTAVPTQTVDFAYFGPLTQTVTIPISGDLRLENDETFFLRLSNPQNGAIADGEGRVTILNDDAPPTLSITETTASAFERTGALTFTVALDAASGLTTTVDYQTVDDTAAAGSDYTAVTDTLILPAGTLSDTITIPLLDDSTPEATETFTVTLANPGNAALGDATAVGTILDDETPPPLAISDAISVSEGSTAVFTVTLDYPYIDDVTVDYATSDGTATSGSGRYADYEASSGSLTIPAGATTITETIDTYWDRISEGNQTFTVTLSNPVNAAIDSGVAIVTIVDRDPLTRIDMADVSVVEDGGALSYRVGLWPQSEYPVSFDYATVDNTATAGADYTAVSRTLTIPPLTFTGVFTVPVIDDALDEPLEMLTVTLSNPVHGWLNRDAVPGAIEDNDPAPAVSVLDTTANEGDGVAAFTVQLDAVSGRDVTVDYATADGTAAAPNDYTAITDTLFLPAGTISDTITIPIVDDALGEADETFTVTLRNPVNATMGDDTGLGAISDNDPVTVDFGSGDYVGDEAGGAVPVTVTLNRPAAFTVTVDYASGDDTATAGADYTPISGTLTFAPGQTAQGISLPVLDDAADEPDETVTITLQNAVSATLGTAHNPAQAVIVDDDGAPTINFSAFGYEVMEDAGSAAITVTLSHPSEHGVTVDLAATGGTATAGVDYTPISETLTFPAGQTIVTTTVPVLDDNLEEGSETVTLTLRNPANGVVGAVNPAALTIVDDVETYTIYMPLVANDMVALPDLVVTGLSVVDDAVQVGIANEGTAAVTTPFWVDVYVDPEPAPTGVNETWQMVADEGLVWGVGGDALPLRPGQSLTLTIGGPYYRPDYSYLDGSIAAGTAVYAQVDSAHAGVAYGAVREIHEQRGDPYNNIVGPIMTSTRMTLSRRAVAPTANTALLPRRAGALRPRR